MYTISFRHTRKTQILYFSEGWSSEGFNNHKTPKHKTIGQLTEAQRSEVDQILQQLEQYPEIWKSIGLTLRGVYDTIIHNPEKLNALLVAIEQAKQVRLNEITAQYEAGDITWPTATAMSHDVVTHYGHLAQESFQKSFSPSLATA